MPLPTAPPHALRLSVAATLCALSLSATSARAQAAPAPGQMPRSPVTVAQAAAPATQAAADAAIRGAVDAWARAWAAKDVERYLASYAPAFKPLEGLSRKAWETQRRTRVGGPRSIEVSISEFELLKRDDGRATATFRQDYRSDRYQDSVRKALELVRDADRWLIVEERVVAAAAEMVAKPAPKKAAEPAAPPGPKAAAEPGVKPAPKPAPAPAPAVTRGISAGLGELQVLSNLGQPLRAEIEIISLRSGDKDNVAVRLASVEAFRQAGMDLHAALSGINLTIELRDGKPIVLVTTRQPVNEPILDLLVELEWGSGRLLREYAILLDPPIYIPPPPAHAVMGPSLAAPAAPPRPKAAPGPAPAPTTPGTGYQVKPGDTLAGIARAHMHAGVTLEQMLIALYRANIGAFIDDDINRLLAGQVLKIPDRDTVAALDPEQATQALSAQMARSPERRRAIAATVPTAPRAEAAPRAGVQPAPSPDQVTLGRAKAAETAASAAREDDRVARERALAEAKARITELEKIVADLRKLLEIRNQRLAELEKRAAEVQAASAIAPVAKPSVEAPKPVVEAPKPVAEAPKPVVEAPKPGVEKAKPAPVKPVPTPPKPAAKPRPAPPAPEPGFIERYIGNLGDPAMLGGLGAVALLLVGYGTYAWRKKKREARSQLSESLLGAATGGASAVSVAAAAQAASVAASAKASDEADPLEEADVYLAYGRDAQAEELLREAVQKGETRPIAYSKLLQIYAKRHDTNKFEATALKLKGLVNGEGPEWEKAMALGRSIDPDNGLYGQGEAARIAPEVDMTEEPEVDFDLDAIMGPGETQATQPEAARPQTVDFALDTTTTGLERSVPADMTLDLDLGSSTAEEPVAPAARTAEPSAATDLGMIDFDLGGTTTEQPAAPSAKAEGDVAPGGIEFDLGEAAAEKPTTAESVPAAAESHLDTISFDLGGTESAAPSTGGSDAKWQEVTTKLQLAKSFEEIGDAEGARELLREVVAEGDAAQRAHAEKMLAGLG